MTVSPLTPFASVAQTSQRPVQAIAGTEQALRTSAKDFETAFLSEALNHMGLDVTKGVAGAEGFSSFLNRAYAEKLSERGGIGLSEGLFNALKARSDEAQKS